MKRILLLSFILLFAHSSFAATEGKFIQKDNPSQLYDRPANTYVAEMIGSPTINILKAKINNASNLIELPFGTYKYEDLFIISIANSFLGHT